MSLLNDPYGKFFNNVMSEFAEPWSVTGDYVTHYSSNSYTIEMPLIGVKKEDLNIKFEENRLIIKAKPSVTSKFAKQKEIQFIVGEDCDSSNILAALENGLLTIKIPRIIPEKKSVNIKVN